MSTSLFESVLAPILEPEAHAAGVLIERLSSEMAAIELRRIEILSTLQTLKKIRDDYNASIAEPREGAEDA